MSTPHTIREDVFARLSPGVLGRAEIRTTTRETMDPASQRFVQLLIDGVPWMNNEVAEDASHAALYAGATGSVLLVGLGLGCDVLLLRDKPEVRSIEVVEIHPDVIALVAPAIRHPKVTVYPADIATWTPPVGRRYDTIWWDLFRDDSNLHPSDKSTFQLMSQGFVALGGQVLFWAHPSVLLQSK